jgi:branched-chain amino acid transport system substrate-binding protein
MGRSRFALAGGGVALLVTLSVTLLAAFENACSLLVDTNANQCAVDSDCDSIHVGARCEDGVCVVVDAGPILDAGPIPCVHNHDCPTTTPNVCDPGLAVCVPLLSAECPTLLGDATDDDAIVFGAIFPTPIDAPPDSLAELSQTGDALRAGLALAVADFASNQNPTHALPPRPGSDAPRPMAFVVCTDQHSSSVAARAADHLALDLHTPAILGTAFSTTTEAIALALAPTSTLLLAPRSAALGSAGSTTTWARLTPDDAVEGAAISAVVADREATIAAAIQGDSGTPTLRVAVVYKDDSYGRALETAVESTLHFNGTDVPGNGSNFTAVTYGNPDAPNYVAQLASAALGVFNARPHIVLMLGTNELVTSILPALEANWVETSYRPYYFLSSGLAVPELWSYLESGDPTGTLRTRIVGTMPVAAGPTYGAFSASFLAQNPTSAPIVAGAAESYDGAYLLAYAVAAIGDQDVTGANLSAGFPLLESSGGALPTSVGPTAIAATFAKLTGGQGISLTGASNTLSFDSTTNTVVGTSTQIWCVPSMNGVIGSAIISGQSVDANTRAIVGSVSAACGD